MSQYNPPYEITDNIVEMISDISVLIGQLNTINRASISPTLRRTNRIRTIYGSLAIEQNTLSLDQVTAVLNGKHIIAPPKDIAEVRNAYEIYDRMLELNPFSMEDLLMAHGVMTHGLVEESGVFRNRPVGVVDQEGNIIHFGSLPDYIPGLMNDLLEWAKNSKAHMLIRSCVFHYEFELIHPFADGNGRLGRLWHTLLLSQWNPIFAWLPIESMIHDNQDEYYKAINISNYHGNSTAFIEFMLSTIKASLMDTIKMSDEMSDAENGKAILRWKIIEQLLTKKGYVMNSDVQRLCNISAATANRTLSEFVKDGKLVKCRINGHWAYTSVEQKS